ncbi:MAG: PAS domain S-box protein [Actinobacteria bacterium]|nr:MAG: PAS domain S-box protein [Actinomycetota bacterium]
MPHSIPEGVLRILERIPMTAVICDVRTGEILWANARDMRIVGATDPSQVIGRNLLEFLDPTQHGVALRDVEAIARGESPEPVTYRINRVGGGSVWVQIASVPIQFGEMPGMLSLIAEVTSREEALRDLAESEERYRQLVETSPDGIVVMVGREIAYANPALTAALGVTLEDVVGASAYDFIAEEYRKPIQEARKAILASGKPDTEAPAVILKADGTRLEVMARTAPVTWHGELATQTVIRFP